MIYEQLKRAFDILSTGIVLVTLLPLFIIVSFLVRRTSPGPAFFRQSRVGLNKHSFNLVKFRTMFVSSDRNRPQVTTRNDTRITSIGRMLRRTKIDELPELWNVFKGEMSLVGPRPEVPRYVAFYKPEWDKVFNVRPGITDFSTLQFRDEESVLDIANDREKAYLDVVLPIKMQLSLKYVEERSFRVDFYIILQTVWSLTLGRFFATPDNSFAVQAKKKIIELGI